MNLDDGFGVALWVAFALLAFGVFVLATDPTFAREIVDVLTWALR